MKAVKGFEIVNIEEDYMAVPTGDNISTFNGTVVLNEVSAFLLKKLKTEASADDLVKAILETYDIDEATARKDVDATIAKMVEIGLVEM